MNRKIKLLGFASLIAGASGAQAQQVSTPSNTQAASPVPGEPVTNAEATPAGPADIVVTASKNQAQTLVQAPLAIQAFSGADLAAKNIRNVDDLVTAIPGASQSEQLGEFIRTYSIRGSGTGGGIGDSLVGYYIDDVPYIIPNAQFAPQVRLLDLDRVEVLRGPYGTLYGAGAMGGTIIFHTKEPNLSKVTADGESYVGSTKGSSKINGGIAAAVSVPLVDDTLAIRISGGYDYRAGYADVYAGAPTGKTREKNANDVDHKDLRAVLLWKPDSDLTVRLQYQHFDGKQDYSQQMSSVDPHYFAFTGNIDGNERSSNDLYAGTVDLDFGFAKLTSSTGYVTFDTSYLYPLNLPVLGGPGLLFNGYTGHSFTQELRLASAGSGPLHWVVGGFYNDALGTFAQTIDFPVPILNGSGTTTTKTKNIAGFGEISYDLADGKLVPLGGIRVYHDDRNFVSNQPTGFTNGTSSPTVVTWRANLAYHPSPAMTVYFNAGTGFRSGITQSQMQVDALARDGIRETTGLNPDRMRNLELGMKGIVRAAHVSFDVNLYDLRYTGIQSVLTTTIGLNAFASLGDAKIQGADVTIQWEPVEGFTLGFSGDANKSDYGQVNSRVAAGLGGNVAPGRRILNQPRYTARFDAGYATPISASASFYSNASASFSDNRINQAGDKTAKTAIVDANVGLRFDGYEVEIFGQNLTDERGPWFIRQAGLIGGPVPRTIGLRGRLHYH